MPDPAKTYSAAGMVETKSVGMVSAMQKQDSHRGLFVDRGVGSPRLAKSPSLANVTIDHKSELDPKVCINIFILYILMLVCNLNSIILMFSLDFEFGGFRIPCQQQQVLLLLQL